MLLLPFIAASRARIDFSLPTKRGITIWGNITISRKGKRGNLARFPPVTLNSSAFSIY
jgi:hypothetical protein